MTALSLMKVYLSSHLGLNKLVKSLLVACPLNGVCALTWGVGSQRHLNVVEDQYFLLAFPAVIRDGGQSGGAT